MNSKTTANGAQAGLERLRKQAKALKKAANSGDRTALARLKAVIGEKTGPIRHSDCLHVIAREAGRASWPVMKFDLETAALDREGRQQRLVQALYEGSEHQVERLLSSDPGLPDGHIGLLAALYDRKGVGEMLKRDAEAATRASGRRTPILHLAFSRHHRAHPEKVADALAIAELLLDHGADVDDNMPVNAQDGSETKWKLSALYGALGHEADAGIWRRSERMSGAMDGCRPPGAARQRAASRDTARSRRALCRSFA